jgi:transposase
LSRMSELIYPDAPGFKVAGPSEKAATRVAGTAAVTRATVLQAFRSHYPQGMTADEVATELNLSVLSVRPRVSELHRNALLADTGQRRKNASGMTATVWRFVPDQPPFRT